MKTLFIIPGFPHERDIKCYRDLERLAKRAGYHVLRVPVNWKYRVMSDYVTEFVAFYEKHKGNHNTVLGFSYGAMIAFISAPQLKPDKLLLCSLSPFFAEDFMTNRASWNRTFDRRMKRRRDDFKQYSAQAVARQFPKKIKVTVLYGELEAIDWPELEKRSQQTAKELCIAPIKIAGVHHDIGASAYQKAILAALET